MKPFVHFSNNPRAESTIQPGITVCQLTQVVALLLWSMKKGRPLGAILISQPGGRKLCCVLCCDLGELQGDGCGDCGFENVSFTALRTWMLLAPWKKKEAKNDAVKYYRSHQTKRRGNRILLTDSGKQINTDPLKHNGWTITWMETSPPERCLNNITKDAGKTISTTICLSKSE